MTQPSPLTSTTFVDGELTNETKWYSRVFTVINWLLGQFGDTGWQTLSLGNSWVSFDGGSTFAIPAYRKLNGVVYLDGEMKSGTTSTTIATLPAGSRPLKAQVYAVTAGPGVAAIQVAANGSITLVQYAASGTNGSVSLNGISFIAEQ